MLLNCVNRQDNCDKNYQEDVFCPKFEKSLYAEWYDKNQDKAMYIRATSKEGYWKEGFRIGLEEAIAEIRSKMTVDNQDRLNESIKELKNLITNNYYTSLEFYKFK